MNLDRALITGLVHDDELSIQERLRYLEVINHPFAETNAPVVKFIRDYFTEYGKAPGIELLTEKFSAFDFRENQEPYRYYLAHSSESKKISQVTTLLREAETALIESPSNAMNILALAARNFDQLDLNSRDLNLREQVTDFISQYTARREQGDTQGIPTGFTNIDNTTYGVHPGDFWVLVARPMSYKTWLMCRMFLTSCQTVEGSVLFFSKEMTKEQIQRRVYAIAGGVSFSDLRRYRLNDVDLAKISTTMASAKATPVIIGRDVKDPYDVSYIRSKIVEYDAKIAFVDGLYLLGKSADWKDQTDSTRSIRDVALATNTGIVGTTQFNRKGGNSATLDNLAYSDSFAQDASVVISLERERDQITERMTKAVKLTTIKVRDDEADHTMHIRVGFKRSQFAEGQGPDLDDEDSWQEDAFNGKTGV